MTEYRLTFNKPAVAQLFITELGEPANGLRVRFHKGRVQFSPVNVTGPDVLVFVPRSRGGVEAIVEGSMAEELMNKLSHAYGPFSLLRRSAGGWIEATPYSLSDNPPKFDPHVRTWGVPVHKRRKPKAVARSEAEFSDETKIHQMFGYLRRAKELVAKHDENPRRGQPSKDLIVARKAINEFNRLVADIIPEIGQIHNILDKFVSPD